VRYAKNNTQVFSAFRITIGKYIPAKKIFFEPKKTVYITVDIAMRNHIHHTNPDGNTRRVANHQIPP
jgi:hypothetical protein